MTRVTPPAFPMLRQVLSGYLHEDFRSEAGTPEAALQMFLADASAEERRRFQRDVERFVAHASTLDLDALRTLVHRLGSRWIPPSRQALITLLADAADLRGHERS